jgi:hypothetical protein
VIALLIRIIAGLAGTALALVFVAAGLRLLHRLEDAAAVAGVTETARATG